MNMDKTMLDTIRNAVITKDFRKVPDEYLGICEVIAEATVMRKKREEALNEIGKYPCYFLTNEGQWLTHTYMVDKYEHEVGYVQSADDFNDWSADNAVAVVHQDSMTLPVMAKNFSRLQTILWYKRVHEVHISEAREIVDKYRSSISKRKE